MISKRNLLVATFLVAMTDMAAAQYVGPSSSTESFLLPSRGGVVTAALLTTGDAIGGYRMSGVPDGLGVFADDVNGGFGLTMNHELGASAGIVRSHGSTGAFVSRWQIDPVSLRVTAGRDHVDGPTNLYLWNNGSYVAGTTAFERFCSADMAGEGAFYHNGKGTTARIFLDGEETTPPYTPDHGRVVAHIATGPEANSSYELPRLGRQANENAVASPYAQDKTIVMLNDDASVDTNVTTNICSVQGQTGCSGAPSELYMYVGTKQTTGNEIEKAGLTNGTLYGIRVKVGDTVVTGESRDFVFASTAPRVTEARFEAVSLGDRSTRTGIQQQEESIANHVTQFMRIEDGAWDPRPGKQNDYYFVTTGRISSSASSWRPSRLWRLRFDDVTNPEAGGHIEMLLTNAFYPSAAATPDGDATYQMFDNIAIDSLGRILLQEDPGGNNRLARVYVYGIESRQLVQVAATNPRFFGGTAATNPDFITNDEESSGITDASSVMGPGWFMLTVQNHKGSADPELVEGGQLLAMYVDPSIARDSASPLVAAVLPTSRSVQVGNPVTAFATLVNTGPAASSCGIGTASAVPGSFSFQTTSASTNQPVGSPNARVSIASGGSQSFVMAFQPYGALPSSDVVFNYECLGVQPAQTVLGVNTMRLTFDTNAGPDMIAIGATPSNDGFAYLSGPAGTGVFAVATTNLGTSASLTARVRLSDSTLPLEATICQTAPATGACVGAPAPTVTATINQNDAGTWGVFLQASGTIAADPGRHRIFVEFVDADGVVRGSTSTAVATRQTSSTAMVTR